jgi:hypothetical protein
MNSRLLSRRLCGTCFSLFVCSSGARPNPKLGLLDQSSLYRIPFDIPQNAPVFVRTPHPMIVRLLLPERQLGPTQYLIRLPRRYPFDPLHALPGGRDRFHQQVHMIAHDDKSADFTQQLLVLRRLKRLHYCVSDTCVLQPDGTRTSAIEEPIHIPESFARCRLLRPLPNRQRAKQASSDKQPRFLRMPMRQHSFVIDFHLR